MKRLNSVITSALFVVLALPGCWSTRSITTPETPSASPSTTPSSSPTSNPPSSGSATMSEENGKIVLKELKTETFIDPASGWSTQRLLDRVLDSTAKVVVVGKYDSTAGWDSPPSDQNLYGSVENKVVSVPIPASANQDGGLGKVSLMVIAPEGGAWKRVGWLLWEKFFDATKWWYNDGGYKFDIKDRHLVPRK